MAGSSKKHSSSGWTGGHYDGAGSSWTPRGGDPLAVQSVNSWMDPGASQPV